MKTIALKEKTFRLLKDLKNEMSIRSFDKIVFELVTDKKNLPDSLFGKLKGKAKPFTLRERTELWKDIDRE